MLSAAALIARSGAIVNRNFSRIVSITSMCALHSRRRDRHTLPGSLTTQTSTQATNGLNATSEKVQRQCGDLLHNGDTKYSAALPAVVETDYGKNPPLMAESKPKC
jgi:hypothetical protein